MLAAGNVVIYIRNHVARVLMHPITHLLGSKKYFSVTTDGFNDF